MSERIAVDPRAEYLSIVNQSPRMQTWLAFHEKQLPEMVSTPRIRNGLNNLIHYYLRQTGDLVPEATLPEVQWIQDEPVVKQLTGGNFMIPIIEFPEHLMPVYERLAGDSVGGLTLTLPIEIASLGGTNTNQSINSQLVLLPHKGAQYSIPYAERRDHELTHAVDPHVDTRGMPGGIIMQEIIAIIGSYSDSFNRYSQIVLHPPYIVPYLIRELEKNGIEGVTREEFIKMFEMINGIVYKSTHTFPKSPNDQITRRIMKCKSFAELQQTWPELFQ